MSYQTYTPEVVSTEARIAWMLCQIIDDDAPVFWTRYISVAHLIANNKELMTDLTLLAQEPTP